MARMKPRSKPIAFICERTVEYVLIGRLARVLSQNYTAIFPFHFSAGREGSAVSELDESLKVVAVFPRRPKILTSGSQEVYVKFNRILFDVAGKARRFGIPVFAGVPLISSLGSLADDPDCAWFLIQSRSSSSSSDVVHRMDLASRRLLTSREEGVEGPLDSKQLLAQVELHARSYWWPEAAENLRKLRKRDDGRLFFFPFGSGAYRPFFFAILEEGPVKGPADPQGLGGWLHR